jgi:hypothetical protein
MRLLMPLLKSVAATQEVAIKLFNQPTLLKIFECFAHLVIVAGHIFALLILPILGVLFCLGIILRLILSYFFNSVSDIYSYFTTKPSVNTKSQVRAQDKREQ